LIGEDEKVNNIKFSKLVFEERDEVRTRFFWWVISYLHHHLA
jgi:hypothetical protein